MKSIVAAVNLTGSWTCGNLTFPAGTPVVLYRNSTIFGNGANVGALLGRHAAGKLLVVSYGGEQLTGQQLQETANFLLQESHRCATLPTFTPGQAWRSACCADLLDGMQRQLDIFDWAQPGILSRFDVLRVAQPCLNLLACGFLPDATVEINNIIPGTDADFLSAARLEQFKQLFASAQQ